MTTSNSGTTKLKRENYNNIRRSLTQTNKEIHGNNINSKTNKNSNIKIGQWNEGNRHIVNTIDRINIMIQESNPYLNTQWIQLLPPW